MIYQMAEQLKQGMNLVKVEGYLNEKKLKVDTDRNGKTYIGGAVYVRLTEDNIIPVEVFQYKLKKDGSENPVFKGLVTVMEEYKDATQVEGGYTNADKVRITRGFIKTNAFVGKDGEVHSSTKYATNFINRVTQEFQPSATFKLDMIIRGLREEVRNDEETGRGFIDGFIVNYSGNLEPVTLVVKENHWSKVERKLNPNESWNIWGDITNTAVTRVIKEEAEIGDDYERVISYTIHERIMTGLKELEGDAVYDEDAIQEAIKKRAGYLDEVKTKSLIEGNTATTNNESKENNSSDPDLSFLDTL